MNFIRHSVSQDRNRFKDDKFDLDLTYITDRVIAMGLPATGFESSFRNDADDVAKMLTQYHGNNFMIFNLSEKAYDYDLFKNHVMEIGWPDHHAPPLQTLFQVIDATHSWIRADPKNVASIHCKAGKGRTGTVIAAYLLYDGHFNEPEDALRFFSEKRSTQKDKHGNFIGGVTIPSQIRSVYYVHAVLSGFEADKRSFVVKKVSLFGKITDKYDSSGVNIYFKIYKNNTELVSPINESDEKTASTFYSSESNSIDLPVENNVVLRGDYVIRFKLRTTFSSSHLFRFSFHTGFIRNNKLCLKKADLDDGKKSKLLAPDFKVEINFDPLEYVLNYYYFIYFKGC